MSTPLATAGSTGYSQYRKLLLVPENQLKLSVKYTSSSWQRLQHSAHFQLMGRRENTIQRENTSFNTNTIYTEGPPACYCTAKPESQCDSDCASTVQWSVLRGWPPATRSHNCPGVVPRRHVQCRARTSVCSWRLGVPGPSSLLSRRARHLFEATSSQPRRQASPSPASGAPVTSW